MTTAHFRSGRVGCGLAWIIVGVTAIAAGDEGTRTYEVGKTVSSFPRREDLSTPEAAYASIHRAIAAEGYSAFDRLSTPRVVSTSRGVPPPAISEAYREKLLRANIDEVHVWDQSHAVVIARQPTRGPGTAFNLRSLERVGRRWLNAGNGKADSLAQARKEVERLCNFERSHRPE
jgi:hypothetical protein